MRAIVLWTFALIISCINLSYLGPSSEKSDVEESCRKEILPFTISMIAEGAIMDSQRFQLSFWASKPWHETPTGHAYISQTLVYILQEDNEHSLEEYNVLNYNGLLNFILLAITPLIWHRLDFLAWDTYKTYIKWFTYRRELCQSF